MPKEKSARVFYWNEQKGGVSTLQQEIERVKAKLMQGEVYQSLWNCKYDDVQVGDRAFFKLVDPQLQGFFAHGRVIPAPEAHQLRLKDKRFKRVSAAYYGNGNINFQVNCDWFQVNCEWHSVVDYNKLIDIKWLPTGLSRTVMLHAGVCSGRSVPPKTMEPLEDFWEKYLVKLSDLGCTQLAVAHSQGKYTNTAMTQLAVAQQQIESKLNPARSSKAANKQRINAIAQRQGAPSFRQVLLEAYQGQCAISECNLETALEAAYIAPNLGNQAPEACNGVLLRADLCTLFDLYLITIDPDTMRVIVAPSIMNTIYRRIHCTPIRLPVYKSEQPSLEALEARRELCVWAKAAWSHRQTRNLMKDYKSGAAGWGSRQAF